jgi:hypothetical protein
MNKSKRMVKFLGTEGSAPWSVRNRQDDVRHNLAIDRAGGLGDARRVARDKERVRRTAEACAAFEGTSAACDSEE